MIYLTHPTGNPFVRALLEAVERRQMDYTIHTTYAYAGDAGRNRWLPALGVTPVLLRPTVVFGRLGGGSSV